MSDLECDVLEELHFLVSFAELKAQTGLDTLLLKDTLKSLLKKKWVQCRRFSADGQPLEADESMHNFDTTYQNYFYLATKAGLCAHYGIRREG